MTSELFFLFLQGINRNLFDSLFGEFKIFTMVYNIAGTISIIECGPLFV